MCPTQNYKGGGNQTQIHDSDSNCDQTAITIVDCNLTPEYDIKSGIQCNHDFDLNGTKCKHDNDSKLGLKSKVIQSDTKCIDRESNTDKVPYRNHDNDSNCKIFEEFTPMLMNDQSLNRNNSVESKDGVSIEINKVDEIL